MRNDTNTYRFCSKVMTESRERSFFTDHVSRRHLQSHQHQFYACERCCTIFPNCNDLNDHKDGPEVCVKVCRNIQCQRRVPRASIGSAVPCDCLNTAEDQWRALYSLRFGVPAPALLEDEEGQPLVRRTNIVDAEESSDGRSADDNVDGNVLTIKENDPGDSVHFDDLLARLEDERKRREEVVDCLGVLWEVRNSSNPQNSHSRFLERWVERLLHQEAPSNAGRPLGSVKTREQSTTSFTNTSQKRTAVQSSPGANFVRPQEPTRSKRRRRANDSRKKPSSSSRPIAGGLIRRKDEQIQPSSSLATVGSSVQQAQSTLAASTLPATAHPDQLGTSTSSSWHAPDLSDLGTGDFDPLLFDAWTANMPDIDWALGSNSFPPPTMQPGSQQR